VYAVGDAVEKTNTVLGIEMPFYMAGPANRQGRIVADVIAGMGHKFKGFIGTGIVGAFDLALAMTGASEKVREPRLHVTHTAFFP
jgi:NADPH-dependent 2,4-dienoyl-CoA reductase/sulfur reductase-like enzyme